MVPFQVQSAKPKSLLCEIGAGISVASGIPDFRSSEGLFRTLKEENPKELLTSGKDLFDSSLFSVRFGVHLAHAIKCNLAYRSPKGRCCFTR